MLQVPDTLPSAGNKMLLLTHKHLMLSLMAAQLRFLGLCKILLSNTKLSHSQSYIHWSLPQPKFTSQPHSLTRCLYLITSANQLYAGCMLKVGISLSFPSTLSHWVQIATHCLKCLQFSNGISTAHAKTQSHNCSLVNQQLARNLWPSILYKLVQLILYILS